VNARRWREFAAARPEMAEAGRRLIYQDRAPLGFIATLRPGGSPRLTPMCPLLAAGGLWLFTVGGSTKHRDLERDPRYTVHAFIAAEDEEFCVAGRALLVPDRETWRLVAAESPNFGGEDEVLFELLIGEARHTTWQHWGTPHLRPVHDIWRAR
jgi:hypothetical protein